MIQLQLNQDLIYICMILSAGGMQVYSLRIDKQHLKI